MQHYILERAGFFQWLDDGGVWRRNAEVAKQFSTLEEAEQAKADTIIGTDFEEDDIKIVQRD